MALTSIGNQSLYPMLSGMQGRAVFQITVALGTGAIAATFGDTNLAVTRTGVGAYTFTFPPIPNGIRSAIVVKSILSPAATIAGALLLSVDSTAGTATFRTFLATPSVAVDGANGDAFCVELTCSTTGVV